jgi:urea transporter
MFTHAPAQADPDAAFASPHDSADSAPSLADPLRTLLRSLGQIVLQRHAGTGACVLAALALCDARLACAALIGATMSNVCALLGGEPLPSIQDGLSGFNGALAGLAAFTFAGDISTAIALALLAAVASAWLGMPLARGLRRAGLAVYSAPCLVATWTWLALGVGGTPGAPDAVASALAPAQPADAWLGSAAGVLSGVAQTVFATGTLPGLVLLAGLAWSSRRAAAYALGGAALAGAIEHAFGAPPASFAAGLCGFNGALAALAASALGTRAAICATMLAAALHLAAVRCGLPAMTAPFALAGWAVHGGWRLPRWLRRRHRHTETREAGVASAHHARHAESGTAAAPQTELQTQLQTAPQARPTVR